MSGLTNKGQAPRYRRATIDVLLYVNVLFIEGKSWHVMGLSTKFFSVEMLEENPLNSGTNSKSSSSDAIITTQPLNPHEDPLLQISDKPRRPQLIDNDLVSTQTSVSPPGSMTDAAQTTKTSNTPPATPSPTSMLGESTGQTTVDKRKLAAVITTPIVVVIILCVCLFFLIRRQKKRRIADEKNARRVSLGPTQQIARRPLPSSLAIPWTATPESSYYTSLNHPSDSNAVRPSAPNGMPYAEAMEEPPPPYLKHSRGAEGGDQPTYLPPSDPQPLSESNLALYGEPPIGVIRSLFAHPEDDTVSEISARGRRDQRRDADTLSVVSDISDTHTEVTPHQMV
ncbi:MAG: hypothetical protein M1829_006729 [Trizodia sp. TS-e1964]|nr:MAG: hypothetical protein M1829_006729 [Trizodia sp. TS-e1964]